MKKKRTQRRKLWIGWKWFVALGILCLLGLIAMGTNDLTEADSSDPRTETLVDNDQAAKDESEAAAKAAVEAEAQQAEDAQKAEAEEKAQQAAAASEAAKVEAEKKAAAKKKTTQTSEAEVYTVTDLFLAEPPVQKKSKAKAKSRSKAKSKAKAKAKAKTKAKADTDKASQATTSAAKSATATVPKPKSGGSVYDDFPHLKQDNNLLGVASRFHVFAREAVLGAHTNGNVAVANLEGRSNFGTKINSGKLATEISYIQDFSEIAGSSFEASTDSRKNKVVFGENLEIDLREAHRPKVKGIYLDHLKAEEVHQDQSGKTYLDFDSEFKKLVETNQRLAQLEGQHKLVEADLGGENHRTIDLTKLKKNANNQIVINLDAAILPFERPLTLVGMETGTNGVTVIINVDTRSNNYAVKSPIKLEYKDGTGRGNGETEDFSGNNLLWNFYNTNETGNQLIGEVAFGCTFQGSLLVPKATINVKGHNLDGNLVAETVNITGETHRWDLQDNGEGDEDPDPKDPDPKDPDPKDPDPKDPDPKDPDPKDPDPKDPDPKDPDPKDPDPKDPDPKDPDPKDPDPQEPEPEDLEIPEPENPDPTPTDPETPEPENPTTDPELPTTETDTNEGGTTDEQGDKISVADEEPYLFSEDHDEAVAPKPALEKKMDAALATPNKAARQNAGKAVLTQLDSAITRAQTANEPIRAARLEQVRTQGMTALNGTGLPQTDNRHLHTVAAAGFVLAIGTILIAWESRRRKRQLEKTQ